jgi:hypothetical protein
LISLSALRRAFGGHVAPLLTRAIAGMIGVMSKPYDPYAYVIRLEAQIVGIEPAITRTLELPRDLNFAQLHEVLQAAFGWTDSHLHQFHVGGLTIGAPEAIEDEAYGPRVFEATEVQLKDLTFPYEVDPALTMMYQYDFGDDWQHKLVLRRGEIEEGVKYPRCIAGSRAAPPEDVGGYSSYGDFLEAWLDPEHEDHKDNRRWAGRKFDPERFDLDATNKAIAKAMRASRGDYRQRQV